MLAARDSFFVAEPVLRGFLGDVRLARSGICVFFATIPVYLKSVTVQGRIFAAMSRNDNSGGTDGAEATNANSVVSGRRDLYCNCSGGARSR